MTARRSAPPRRAGDGGQSARSARLKKADPGPDHRAIRTVRTPEKDGCDALLIRLEAMREEIIAAMVRKPAPAEAGGFSAGLGALLAQIAAALDALGKVPQNAAERGNADKLSTTREGEIANRAPSPLPAIGGPAAGYDPAADSLGSWRDAVSELRCRHRRAVVASDGEAIRLTLYGETGALGSVILDPARAVGLASELCAAAHRRMTP